MLIYGVTSQPTSMFVRLAGESVDITDYVYDSEQSTLIVPFPDGIYASYILFNVRF